MRTSGERLIASWGLEDLLSCRDPGVPSLISLFVEGSYSKYKGKLEVETIWEFSLIKIISISKIGLVLSQIAHAFCNLI